MGGYTLCKLVELVSFIKSIHGYVSVDLIRRYQHPFFCKVLEKKDGWVLLSKVYITHSDKPITHPFDKSKKLTSVWVGKYYDPKLAKWINQYTQGVEYRVWVSEAVYKKHVIAFNKLMGSNTEELFKNTYATTNERSIIIICKSIGIESEWLPKNDFFQNLNNFSKPEE